MQPPNVPLRDPHPLSSIYDVAMFVSPDYSESLVRSFSLLPPHETGIYTLSEENYVFANDSVPRPDGTPQTWYTMDTTIPFVQSTGGIETWGKYDAEEVEHNGLQWAGPKDLRPSTSSPLYSALHELSVSLTCSYDLEGKDGHGQARENLAFKVPITFARLEPRVAEMTSGVEGSSVALPIYSQLYDVNGDRKIDYSTPLPLYCPRAQEVSANGSASANVSVHRGVNNLDAELAKRHTQIIVDGAHSQPTMTTDF